MTKKFFLAIFWLLVCLVTICLLSIPLFLLFSMVTEGVNLSKDVATTDGGRGTEAPDFNDLLDAIERVESGENSRAVGDDGAGVGAYQIHKIYVRDCNRILELQGSNERFTYEDRWDRNKSRKMTAIVIRHYGRGDYETMARAHNCPTKRYDKSTEKYWGKIKLELAKHGIKYWKKKACGDHYCTITAAAEKEGEK